MHHYYKSFTGIAYVRSGLCHSCHPGLKLCNELSALLFSALELLAPAILAPTAASGTLDSHAQDLAEVVQEMGTAPVMVAHSFGGLIAQKYVSVIPTALVWQCADANQGLSVCGAANMHVAVNLKPLLLDSTSASCV